MAAGEVSEKQKAERGKPKGTAVAGGEFKQGEERVNGRLAEGQRIVADLRPCGNGLLAALGDGKPESEKQNRGDKHRPKLAQSGKQGGACGRGWFEPPHHQHQQGGDEQAVFVGEKAEDKGEMGEFVVMVGIEPEGEQEPQEKQRMEKGGDIGHGFVMEGAKGEERDGR